MSKGRGFVFFMAISIIVTSVAFLPLSSKGQEIKRGGTAIIVLGDTPAYLNTAISYQPAVSVVSASMFEGLINYDLKGNMLPELARSWEFARDGKTWIFHLQSGVKWHDGKDFTSADVAFSLKEVSEKFHPLGKQAFGPITRIETPDPNTAVFKFETPHTPALACLTFWHGPILPKHLYENTDILKNPYNLKPVGTGPYMFEEYKMGSHISVVRNPNYWQKGKPYLDKVIYRIMTDAPGRIAAFEKGEVDVIPPYWMPYSDAKRLQEKAQIAAFPTLQAALNLVPINLNNKILADRRVRYALVHAINRQEIIDKAYFGFGKVPVGPIPSAIPWAFTDDVPKFEYNPAKANQLLDEAGYKRGSDGMRFSLSMPYVGTYTDWDRAVKIMQAQLREVGIDVKLKSYEYVACQDEIFKKRNYDLSYWLLAMGPDPAVGTARLYLTSQIRVTTGFTNAMNYSNPEVDRLFAEAAASPSLEAAGRKYKEIQKMMVQDMPCLWINENQYIDAISSKLEGLPDNVWGGVGHLEGAWWKK